MYKGDGSFKTKEVERQKSLIELLELEREVVDKYNNKAISIDLAKKNALNTTELYTELEKISESLSLIRTEISEYLSKNLNIKTNLGDILYNDDKQDIVESNKKIIGYDKNRNPVYLN